MNPKLSPAITEIERVIVGKTHTLTKLVVSILANGHILLDDVPGVGKTTLAMATAKVLGLNYRRIQFTPDVLPSDITGFSVYNKDTSSLKYMPGAVNGANILLGDEINRTSSKTQSALLEAMEERQVTVDGTTHPLENPFIVIATQNNVGSAGTQLLPFAQLDRFIMKLSLGYPDFKSQMTIIKDRQAGNPIAGVHQMLSVADIVAMQQEVQNITIKDPVIEYIANIAEASRQDSNIELGISPRGALFMARAAKAHAYVAGRNYATPQDVRDVAVDTQAHRIILSPTARTSHTTQAAAIENILAKVAVPDGI